MSLWARGLDYLRRNGVKRTFFAALERLVSSEDRDYRKRDLDHEELRKQRERVFEHPLSFDILVPAYHTDPEHFAAMTASVMDQTYGGFRLLIGDAGRQDRLKELALRHHDERVVYIPLDHNGGISANTNQLLVQSRGDYIVLLDHDDIIEPDALYRLMEAVQKCCEENGALPALIYSDEDKCDSEGKRYMEPHFKTKFNQELLLSNNYICHLLCVRRDLALEAGFRSEYDGAQDHDFILRIWGAVEDPRLFIHIPGVLYHWRAHEDSTASNPGAKTYAYDAGRRAVEDFCKSKGWEVRVADSPHRGFFRVIYKGSIFRQRKDVGALSGPVIKGGHIISGAMDSDGVALYKGLPVFFSGYMHRGAMVQDVDAADIRNMVLRPELEPLLQSKEVTSATDPVSASLAISRLVREKGYRVLYDPEVKEVGYAACYGGHT